MSLPDQNPYASPSLASAPIRPFAPSSSAGQLATRGQRFLGSLIDGLIVFPVAFVLGMGMGLGLALLGFAPDSIEFRVIAAVLGVILGGGAFTAIHGYLLATRGQTVGKYLLKMQIVSDDGQLVPLGMLIAKRYLPLWLVSQIPIVGFLVLMANALAIFRESHKCFHDDIAGTKVIQL